MVVVFCCLSLGAPLSISELQKTKVSNAVQMIQVQKRLLAPIAKHEAIPETFRCALLFLGLV